MVVVARVFCGGARKLYSFRSERLRRDREGMRLFGSDMLEEMQPPLTKVGDGGSLSFGHAVFVERANVESREKKEIELSVGDGEFGMAEKEGNHCSWQHVMVRSFRVSTMEAKALVESLHRERERERVKH